MASDQAILYIFRHHFTEDNLLVISRISHVCIDSIMLLPGYPRYGLWHAFGHLKKKRDCINIVLHVFLLIYCFLLCALNIAVHVNVLDLIIYALHF